MLLPRRSQPCPSLENLGCNANLVDMERQIERREYFERARSRRTISARLTLPGYETESDLTA